MPNINVNGVNLHYTDTGGGGAAIVFSHGLIMSGKMFSAQIERLKGRYRCITYDHRGQGGSQVTDSGYDMDTLTDDAVALINELGIAPCHFVGLSMGGFVGMRLASRHPQLVRSLALLETSADEEPEENAPKYRMLNFVARWFGLGLVVGKVMPILFGKTFMSDPSRSADRKLWRDRIVIEPSTTKNASSSASWWCHTKEPSSLAIFMAVPFTSPTMRGAQVSSNESRASWTLILGGRLTQVMVEMSPPARDLSRAGLQGSRRPHDRRPARGRRRQRACAVGHRVAPRQPGVIRNRRVAPRPRRPGSTG